MQHWILELVTELAAKHWRVGKACSMVMLDNGCLLTLVGQTGITRDFLTILRVACNLKLRNFSLEFSGFY